MVTHSAEQVLTQRVYQILAGYFDGNDAQALRDDPLFQTLCDGSPDDRPLASGSTLNRFQHAYTRREAEKPSHEREVLFEQRAAHVERIGQLNRYLAELFINTRRGRPERIVLDIDATDDPTHGERATVAVRRLPSPVSVQAALGVRGGDGLSTGRASAARHGA